MAKKKNIKVGTISGMDVLRQTRPPQDIPFRTGSYTDKRKKREKINKNRLDKWLQIGYNIDRKKEKDKTEREERKMTMRELIAELNELIADGEVNENAIVTNAEGDDIFSVVESMDNENGVVIYF